MSLHANDDSNALILQQTLNAYIIPSYQRLQTTTKNLHDHISILCKQPNQQNLLLLYQSFYDVVRAWSMIEWFRVGPITEQYRIERFLYYPDRKSRGLRQVKRALANGNSDILDIKKLQKMSVALQGLGALDYILFGKDYNELLSKDNPLFRTDKEAMNVMLATIIHGLEAIRDVRVNAFLKATPKKDHPKSAIYRRSQATILSLIANIQGLESFFNNSQLELFLNKESRMLAHNIRFEFQQSLNTAKKLDAPIAESLKNPKKRKQLEYLRYTFDFLLNRFNNEFAVLSGLVTGFSFGDGD